MKSLRVKEGPTVDTISVLFFWMWAGLALQLLNELTKWDERILPQVVSQMRPRPRNCYGDTGDQCLFEEKMILELFISSLQHHTAGLDASDSCLIRWGYKQWGLDWDRRMEVGFPLAKPINTSPLLLLHFWQTGMEPRELHSRKMEGCHMQSLSHWLETVIHLGELSEMAHTRSLARGELAFASSHCHLRTYL